MPIKRSLCLWLVLIISAQCQSDESRFVLTKKDVPRDPLVLSQSAKPGTIKICGSTQVANLISKYLAAENRAQLEEIVTDRSPARLPTDLTWRSWRQDCVALEPNTEKITIFGTFRFSNGKERLYFVCSVPGDSSARDFPRLNGVRKRARLAGMKPPPLPTLTRELVSLADTGADAAELAGALQEKAPGLASQIGRAGLMHTYGYLLSNLRTPFGFKRERYTQTTITRGLGLRPLDLLSPRPRGNAS